MTSLMPWDELNVLRERTLFKLSSANLAENTEDILDELFDLFLLAYLDGVDQTNSDLKTDVKPDTQKMQDSIYFKIDGIDYKQRVMQYIEQNDVEGIMRLAETEMHRNYETGAYDTAISVEEMGTPVKKRWFTMMDDKVRDTHQYLQGMEVGVNDYFYTDDGDSALYPGGFSLPENNVNCRCIVVYV